MRRAEALIALVLAGPAAAITVPPALMPPTPPPLTTLPPAAQPMQTVTGLRTGITPRQRMVPPQLTEEERARGVIAMSAGNHAQVVAYHAQRMG